MKNNNSKKGFTLIELLVVIAIIGVLSGVIMQSLTYTRQNSRDTIRKDQLNGLRTAITSYFTTIGSYPSTGGVWFSSEVGDAVSNYGGDWIPGLVSGAYISALPKDPVGGAGAPNPPCTSPWKRAYLYRSDGIHYKLISMCALESSYPDANNTFYDPARPTYSIQVTDDPATTATW